MIDRSDHEPVNLLLIATANDREQGTSRGLQGLVEETRLDIGAGLNLEAKGLGRIDHRSLGTNEITVQIEGPRSTTWPEEGGDNPIEVMAEVLGTLSDLRQEIERKNGDVHMNLGTIAGGESAETVPYECELTLQIRSRSNRRLVELKQRILERLEPIRSSTEFPMRLKETLREPAGAIERDHWLVNTVEEIHRELDITSRPGATSSDASLFMRRGIPALTIGLGREEHVYREEEQLAVDSLKPGQLQLLGLVKETEERFRQAS